MHVLLSIGILMALACTATPAPTPTPSGPMYSKAEAMAILKEHLQSKMLPGEQYPCLLAIEDIHLNPKLATWEASYDAEEHVWNITARKEVKSAGPSSTGPWSKLIDPNNKLALKMYFWSVYERTGSIVPTGGDPLNQMC